MRQIQLVAMVVIMIVMAVSLIPAYASWEYRSDISEVWFYPDADKLLYVDRASPLSFFGLETVLKVGDSAPVIWTDYPYTTAAYNAGTPETAVDPETGKTVYQFQKVDAKRTYIQFNTDEFQTALSPYTITGAKLVLSLTGMNDLAPSKAEPVNVRLVTSAATSDYLDGLTWDLQSKDNMHVTFGQVYAVTGFGNVPAGFPVAKEWEDAQAYGNSMAELVEGWNSGAIANYGLVLENDFDGAWQERVDATLYWIENKDEMNELIAGFNKGAVLKVAVAPKVVPEPLSCALMLLGSGVLGLAAKRKKKG